MSEVLDQSEIDALLASVGADAGDGGLLSDEKKLSDQFGLCDEGAAAVYDFKRPGRVSKDQIRALTSIHSVFARNLAVTLSGFLRSIVDVRVVSVEQLTYSEFIHSLPTPTCFMVLQAPPLEGQMCLEVSPLIVFPIVDRLLGGSNQNLYIPQRALTSIEWRLMTRIVERALEHLSDVWHNLVDARFEPVETESNPQLVHIVAPTEVVVFITFEIKLGQTAGTMSLCVPFNTIESVLSHITTQSWFYKPKAASADHQQRLLHNLQKSSTTVTAYLGSATIRLGELRDLAPGDLIPLRKLADAEVIVQVAGRNKFAARPGQLRGKRAVCLTRAAASDEPI